MKRINAQIYILTLLTLLVISCEFELPEKIPNASSESECLIESIKSNSGAFFEGELAENSILYEYDNANRIKEIGYYNFKNEIYQYKNQYTYGLNGNLIGYNTTYIGSDREWNQKSSFMYVGDKLSKRIIEGRLAPYDDELIEEQYTYNQTGQLKESFKRIDGVVVSYTDSYLYDEGGSLLSFVTHQGDKTFVDEYTYDNLSRETIRQTKNLSDGSVILKKESTYNVKGFLSKEAYYTIGIKTSEIVYTAFNSTGKVLESEHYTYSLENGKLLSKTTRTYFLKCL